MCDELTAADNARFLMSRRAFGAGAAAAGVAAMLPVPANAAEIKGRDVTIRMPGDLVCDAYFVAPASGKHPAVLVWPDIFGLRPAFRQMADRLAQSGYAVLTVNQFYRSTKTPFVKTGQGFDDALKAKVGPWRALLTPAATASDARMFGAFLDRQPEVDGGRGMGTTGYCMGGPMMLRTAEALRARVRAGASFHGGGLVTDAPDSPHLLVPKLKGRYLFCIAENDDKSAPDAKDKLAAAFAAAKVPAEIEVYKGTMHGWCPPDSQVYDAERANRAWDRLLATFATL